MNYFVLSNMQLIGPFKSFRKAANWAEKYCEHAFDIKISVNPEAKETT